MWINENFNPVLLLDTKAEDQINHKGFSYVTHLSLNLKIPHTPFICLPFINSNQNSSSQVRQMPNPKSKFFSKNYATWTSLMMDRWKGRWKIEETEGKSRKNLNEWLNRRKSKEREISPFKQTIKERIDQSTVGKRLVDVLVEVDFS